MRRLLALSLFAIGLPSAAVHADNPIIQTIFMYYRRRRPKQPVTTPAPPPPAVPAL